MSDSKNAPSGTMIAMPDEAPRASPPPPPPDGGPKATVIASSAGGGGGTMIAAGAEAEPIGVVEVQAPAGDLIGVVLDGRYKVDKKLGEGGMGTVYRARHTTIGKEVAIKVLSGEYAHKKDLVDRFLQEARAASSIAHENIIEITDYGNTPDGSVYFVMEFLKGEDLSNTVEKNGPLPWARCKPIMVQICRALQAAHEKGIIHRDMKPENCYRVTRGGTEDFIKVLDFGIAKMTSDEGEGGKGLTRTGMIFGTPEYMSPEQAQGAKVDHRVDIYAVGVIMFELLTGSVPFKADTFMGILTKHMFEVPERPSLVCTTNEIPLEAENVILKAMQKDRDLRFQSMDEMMGAIEAVGTGAGGVLVVSENIVRPNQGRMDFTGDRAATGGTMPPMSAPDFGADPQPQRSNKGGVIAVALAAVVLIGGGAAVFAMSQQNQAVAQDEVASKEGDNSKGGKGDEAKPGDPDAAGADGTKTGGNGAPLQGTGGTGGSAAGAGVGEGTDAAPVKVFAADAKTVNVKITTPDVGQVLDPRDMGIYGATNSLEGMPFEESETEIQILVRVPGFEDLEWKILPNRDKEIDLGKQLKKKAVAKSGGGSSKSGGKTGGSDKAPADTKGDEKTGSEKGGGRTTPPIDTNKKSGGTSPKDLKDPFSRNK